MALLSSTSCQIEPSTVKVPNVRACAGTVQLSWIASLPARSFLRWLTGSCLPLSHDPVGGVPVPLQLLAPAVLDHPSHNSNLSAMQAVLV